MTSAKGIGIPVKLLHESEGHTVTVGGGIGGWIDYCGGGIGEERGYRGIGEIIVWFLSAVACEL